MRKVRRARGVMRKEFKKDPGFKMTYIANVAECLDMNGYSGISKKSRGAVSEKIINLIFDIKD